MPALPALLVGHPINFAGCLIGSPITWHFAAAQVRNLSETLMVGPPLLLLPGCEGLTDIDEMEANEEAMAATCQVCLLSRLAMPSDGVAQGQDRWQGSGGCAARNMQQGKIGTTRNFSYARLF